MTHLLDTDVCIDLLRSRDPALAGRMQRLEPVAVSTVTSFELWYGADLSPTRDHDVRVVEEFLTRLSVVPFDDAAARAAGEVRAHLRRRGSMIGAYDLLIAGHALVLGATLVTRNVREFRRVPGLSIARW